MYTGMITTRVEARLAAFTAVFDNASNVSIEETIDKARKVEDYLTKGMTMPDFEQPYSSKDILADMVKAMSFTHDENKTPPDAD